MREPEKCIIEYCGYNKPKNPEEIEFEILGLQTAICMAEKKIADLKQSQFLASKMFQQIQGGSDEDNLG